VHFLFVSMPADTPKEERITQKEPSFLS